MRAIVLILLMAPCFVLCGQAAVIDFDATYNSASGWPLVPNINAAVAAANPGDTIQFASTSYDFEGQGFGGFQVHSVMTSVSP